MGVECEEYSDETASEINDWFEKTWSEFRDSPLAQELEEETLNNAGFMCSCFYDYAYGYCLSTPQKITTDVIDEMCFDVLPRKLSCDKSTYEAFEPGLTLFLTWCETEGRLKNTKKLIKHVKTVAKEMVKKSQDSSNWGMAKSLFMGGGFDFGETQDGAEDGKVIEFQKPVTIKAEPKIGRNEPCSCGSGKKYKKCCGK